MENKSRVNTLGTDGQLPCHRLNRTRTRAVSTVAPDAQVVQSIAEVGGKPMRRSSQVRSTLAKCQQAGARQSSRSLAGAGSLRHAAFARRSFTPLPLLVQAPNSEMGTFFYRSVFWKGPKSFEFHGNRFSRPHQEAAHTVGIYDI